MNISSNDGYNRYKEMKKGGMDMKIFFAEETEEETQENDQDTGVYAPGWYI